MFAGFVRQLFGLLFQKNGQIFSNHIVNLLPQAMKEKQKCFCRYFCRLSLGNCFGYFFKRMGNFSDLLVTLLPQVMKQKLECLCRYFCRFWLEMFWLLFEKLDHFFQSLVTLLYSQCELIFKHQTWIKMVSTDTDLSFFVRKQLIN